LAPGTQYIDRRLIKMPGEFVRSIQLKNNFGTVVLTADTEGWQGSGDFTKRADPSVVEEFIHAMDQRRASSTLEADGSLELGEVVAHLELSDGKTTRTVEVGQEYPPNPKFRLARRDDADFFMLLSREISEELQLPPLHWADRVLMPLKGNEIL